MSKVNLTEQEIDGVEDKLLNIKFKLDQEKTRLMDAGSKNLAMPITFIRNQIEFVSSHLGEIEIALNPSANTELLEVAFLFPSNTEGAMVIFVVSRMVAFGLKVHVKLSKRSQGIQKVIEQIFSNIPNVIFYHGSGNNFIYQMLRNPNIEFIQVYGSDKWIYQYESAVKESGKTFAFEGPGKDPLIVLKGANIQAAVEGAVASGLFAGGAACMSPERYLVHESLSSEFVDGLVSSLQDIAPSPPSNPESQLGYMYSEKAALSAKQQIDDAVSHGAKILLGGKIEEISKGSQFFACEPTVLVNIPRSASLLFEETFAPIFPIITFDSKQEVLRIANETQYGLSATIFGEKGEDLSPITEDLRSTHSIVYENQNMTEAFHPDEWGSGGFKNSGWIWETTDAGFIKKTGHRKLVTEIESILLNITWRKK